MKALFTILGAFALLMGLLWMGQGAGVIRWPAESFMIDTSVWTLWGALLALVGAGLIWLGGRGRNPS